MNSTSLALPCMFCERVCYCSHLFASLSQLSYLLVLCSPFLPSWPFNKRTGSATICNDAQGVKTGCFLNSCARQAAFIHLRGPVQVHFHHYQLCHMFCFHHMLTPFPLTCKTPFKPCGSMRVCAIGCLLFSLFAILSHLSSFLVACNHDNFIRGPSALSGASSFPFGTFDNKFWRIESPTRTLRDLHFIFA